MCTAITLQDAQGEWFMGRTMDFSYLLDPYLYAVPKGCRWQSVTGSAQLQSRYRLMGIGQKTPQLIFADGVNEMGLAAAVLYFPGYAEFPPDDGNPLIPAIAANELILYLLGTCANTDQVLAALSAVRVVGVADAVTGTVAPLHWMVTDREGRCLVLEQTKDGMQIYPNALGVLANSPDFPWHMTNLRNYLSVRPGPPDDTQWGDIELKPFGQGAGTFGLPGDYASPSRFVRAAYLKTHTAQPENRNTAVITGFHILENVSIPQNVVLTQRETADFTQYTAFMNTARGEYFIRSYPNSEIVTRRLANTSVAGAVPVPMLKIIRPITFLSL